MKFRMILLKRLFLFIADNQYKVAVYTGNKRGAGTDANVYINIYGNLGETGAIMLDNKENNFESGK
jgi:hypothetical protein